MQLDNIYAHFDQFFQILADPHTHEFHSCPKFSRWCYNQPEAFYNGFLLKPQHENDWKEVIETNLAFFKEKQLPTSCFFPSNPHLDQINAHLQSLQYTSPGPYQVALLDLGHTQSKPVAEFCVKQVLTDNQLQTWTDLVTTIFFPDQPIGPFIYENYKKLGYAPSCPMRHYIGYVQDQAVAAASLLLTYNTDGSAKISGLWNAGVLKEWRKKGFGRAMAETRIQEAQSLGFKQIVCFMEADGLAWSYCRPLGFKIVHALTPYFSTST